MNMDFINTLEETFSPVIDLIPKDQIEGALDTVGMKDVVTNFELPSEITNVFKGTPFEHYLPNGKSNLLKPGSIINKVVTAANEDINTIYSKLKEAFGFKGINPIDFSGWLVLLMELCGISVVGYVGYRLILKKKT